MNTTNELEQYLTKENFQRLHSHPREGVRDVRIDLWMRNRAAVYILHFSDGSCEALLPALNGNESASRSAEARLDAVAESIYQQDR